jgi:AraC family transcriptional regulator
VRSARASFGSVKPETQSFYERAVQRALEHVVAHLDDALDLERLARHAALSPFHFHRIFRGMVGETPLELHRRLRLERAAQHLLQTETPVTTLALEAGYDTHEAFTRAFRRHYGYPPSELRKELLEGTSCARPHQIEIATRSGLHFRADARAYDLSHLIQGDRNMNVTIENRPELRTATLRHIGPYHRISEAFARLGDLAGHAGLLDVRPTMLAIYHDDPEVTPESELRSDAAIVIPPDVRVPDGLTEQHVPGGRYAKTTHLGPYSELGDTWARFMGQWLPGSGERLGSGVTYEIYVNNPTEVAPEQLHTDLYIPLA